MFLGGVIKLKISRQRAFLPFFQTGPTNHCNFYLKQLNYLFFVDQGYILNAVSKFRHETIKKIRKILVFFLIINYRFYALFSDIFILRLSFIWTILTILLTEELHLRCIWGCHRTKIGCNLLTNVWLHITRNSTHYLNILAKHPSWLLSKLGGWKVSNTERYC